MDLAYYLNRMEHSFGKPQAIGAGENRSFLFVIHPSGWKWLFHKMTVNLFVAYREHVYRDDIARFSENVHRLAVGWNPGYGSFPDGMVANIAVMLGDEIHPAAIEYVKATGFDRAGVYKIPILLHTATNAFDYFPARSSRVDAKTIGALRQLIREKIAMGRG